MPRYITMYQVFDGTSMPLYPGDRVLHVRRNPFASMGLDVTVELADSDGRPVTRRVHRQYLGQVPEGHEYLGSIEGFAGDVEHYYLNPQVQS